MTPKEKAEELIGKFNYESKHFLMLDAKKCALIAVDEILNNDVGYNAYDGVIGNNIWIDTGYWQEVKQEIEKL